MIQIEVQGLRRSRRERLGGWVNHRIPDAIFCRDEVPVNDIDVLLRSELASSRRRTAGLENGADGEAVGRDPRRMTAAELGSLGHQPMSPIAALRARCIDCCAGQAGEVRLCAAVNCPAWSFRMGKNP